MANMIGCPQCARRLAVKESALGKKVRCPSCQNIFTAPSPDVPEIPVLLPVEPEDAKSAITAPSSPLPPEVPRGRRKPRKRPPRKDQRLPRYYFALALFPLGIPIITLGGWIFCGAGVGLAAACLVLLLFENISAARRITLAATISIMGYVTLIAFLLVAAFLQPVNLPQANPFPAPRPDPNQVEEFAPPGVDHPDQHPVGNFDNIWREVSPRNEVSVEMPGQPSEQPEDVPSIDGRANQVRFVLRTKGVECAVYVQTVPADRLKVHSLEDRLQAALKFAEERHQGKNLQQRAIKVDGWLGREGEFDTERGFRYFCRVCAAREGDVVHLVHLTLGARGLERKAPGVRKFLESLRLPNPENSRLVEIDGRRIWRFAVRPLGAVFVDEGKALLTVTLNGSIHVTDLTPRPCQTVWPALDGQAIRSFAVSPDSTLVALGGQGGPIFLCERATGAIKGTIHQPREGPVPAAGSPIAFSPDGQYLASATNRARVWMVRDQKVVWEMAPEKAKERTVSLGFSPDGKTLAMGRPNGKVELCDARTGQSITVLDAGGPGDVDTLAFSLDGSILAGGGRKLGLRLWDLATREPYAPREAFVSLACVFRKEPALGKTVIALGAKNLAFFNGGNGSTKVLFPAVDNAFTLAVSPQGTELALVAPTEIQVWRFPHAAPERVRAAVAPQVLSDPQGRKLLKSMDGPVLALEFSEDEKLLTTVSQHGTVAAWNLAPLELRSTCHVEFSNPLGNAVLSRDGRWIAATGNRQLLVFDQRTGKRLANDVNVDEVRHLVMAPDGNRLAVVKRDNTVTVWQLPTLRLLHALPGSSATFSPDGKLLAVGDVNHTARLLDPPTGKELLRTPATELRRTIHLAFSPDSSRLAAKDESGWIRVTDLKTMESTLHRPLLINSFSMAFSGNNKLALGSRDGIVLWDLANKKFAATAKYPGASDSEMAVIGVTYSPRQTYLAGSRGEVVQIADVASLTQQYPPTRLFTGTPAQFHTAVFAADSRTVYTGGVDQVMRKLDLGTGQIVQSEPWGMVPLRLVPDGKHMLCWEGGAANTTEFARGKLRLRNLETGATLPDALERNPIAVPPRLVFSPAGDNLLLVSFNVPLQGVRLPTFTPETKWAAFGSFDAAALSPDGKLLAGFNRNMTLQVVEIATRSKLVARKSDMVRKSPTNARLFFTPDSKTVIAVTDQGTAQLIDAASGKDLRSLPLTQSGNFTVAFHPGGRWLALADTTTAVALWDLTTSKCVAELEIPAANQKPPFNDNLPSLSFALDGTSLIAAGRHQIAVWELTGILPRER